MSEYCNFFPVVFLPRDLNSGLLFYWPLSTGSHGVAFLEDLINICREKLYILSLGLSLPISGFYFQYIFAK